MEGVDRPNTTHKLVIVWNVAFVASVSVRFRSKERGMRVKDRGTNGASKRAGRGRFISRSVKTENPLPRSFFAPKRNGNACYAGYVKTWPYSFALTRMFPSDVDLLYEMMGGSFYIFLSVVVDLELSAILLIKMFLRFGKAEWYVVTKGRIFFCASLFFRKSRLPFGKVNLRGDFFLWDCESNL